MAKKFLVNLDLTKNQILNAAIQNLSSAPSSPVSGQIYYNTMDSRMYFWDGSTWIDMSGDIREVLGGNGLSASNTSGVVTLDINVDNMSIELSGDSLKVKDGGIDIYKIANLSTNIVNNNSDSAIPTADAVKKYVDQVTGSLGNLEGGWDMASNGTFPQATPPNLIKKGDFWFITSAGSVMGSSWTVTLEIGDVAVAKIDNPSSYNQEDWIFLQTNKDAASQDRAGFIQIATNDDLTAAYDDTKAVTPLKLKTYLDNRTGGYATYLGNGFESSFTVSHNLGTTDVSVSLYEGGLGGQEVFADVTILNNNSIRVDFAVAPENWGYRVVIKK